MNNKKLYQLASIGFFISGIIFLVTGLRNHETSPIMGIFQIMLGISFMAMSRNNKK
ncbi:hypothetical protein [Lactococcus lactis]|jgi:hypothetical protein|uniref:hypothetical protein n=1 Tax=Lactococcus lactis TaxID=1358 RepID=UPI00035EA6A7|nr:hypothetical protein [Lactococcus lactis]QOK51353.1 hypothetical protein HZ322_12050 [Lactococcus lactis]